MISDQKKEEVRSAADIVEVVSDYVKLKRSGNGFIGLCPYHNEKTPSFHVTPNLGIFKCFGCGRSGDIFQFVMDQEGVSFTEAIRQLGERYGVFIPESEEHEPGDQYKQKEGIYHALKFAGIFYYRNLVENPEAEIARKYLEERGYSGKVYKTYGLGYSPSSGNELWKAAKNANIDEQYLLEADLIKPSQRGQGYFDTFRGRLMFPIFSATGKVIAFAGRVLGKEKTAKYINSAQTQVYNKSEVLYGLNFAKNEIRKQKEIVLVEGYTDVITLHEHGITNAVASSGTALTAGQMKVLHKYGDKIVMIYDADGAGQAAMKRGIEIALAEGMEVMLLELPDKEDPDSFVKQFGKDSFLELKKKESLDFVDFLMLKADEEGRLQSPAEQSKTIEEVLEAIANIKNELRRQVYVQHLHQRAQQFRRGTDRELFEELERILARKREEETQDRRREQMQRAALPAGEESGAPQNEAAGHPAADSTDIRRGTAESESAPKRAEFEKEIIRLMLIHGRKMIEYIGSFVHDGMFEDEQLRMFYLNIFTKYDEEEEITPKIYSGMKEPFPELLGDVLLEQYTVSDRHYEKIGQQYSRDKYPFASARSAMKALELNFYVRKSDEFADRLINADEKEKKKLVTARAEVQKRIRHLRIWELTKLYPRHEFEEVNKVETDRFEYTMKKK